MHAYTHICTVYPHLFEAYLCVHVMLYVLYNTASKFGATDDKEDDNAVNRDWED